MTSARSDQLPFDAVVRAKAPHGEEHPEQHEQRAEHEREETGAHAQRRAERIVAPDDERARADRDQHDAGPEVLAVGKFHWRVTGWGRCLRIDRQIEE